MVNSKGGFLVEEGREVDEEERRKEVQREKQRAKQNVEPREFENNMEFLYSLNVASSR